MERQAFGTSGLQVTRLGFGAMHLNDERVDEAQAARLLNEVLDLGVNLIDTARGYGLSEERIGRHLAHRRGDFVLSTKVGYGIPGHEDWTYGCIVAGVEAALQRMRCGYLDIVHLHSCPREVLQRGDVPRALQDCAQAGKLRVCAYSGDNEALQYAMDSGWFQGVQTSISVCDQGNLGARLPQAQAQGLGVIAKRPVAGMVWRHATRPEAYAEGIYWDRWHTMGLAQAHPGVDWSRDALRFTAFQPGVSSTIVGTGQLAHFKANCEAVAAGPLPAELQAAIRGSFMAHGSQWPTLI